MAVIKQLDSSNFAVRIARKLMPYKTTRSDQIEIKLLPTYNAILNKYYPMELFSNSQKYYKLIALYNFIYFFYFLNTKKLNIHQNIRKVITP